MSPSASCVIISEKNEAPPLADIHNVTCRLATLAARPAGSASGRPRIELSQRGRRGAPERWLIFDYCLFVCLSICLYVCRRGRECRCPCIEATPGGWPRRHQGPQAASRSLGVATSEPVRCPKKAQIQFRRVGGNSNIRPSCGLHRPNISHLVKRSNKCWRTSGHRTSSLAANFITSLLFGAPHLAATKVQEQHQESSSLSVCVWRQNNSQRLLFLI